MHSALPLRHQGNESLFLAVEMSLVSTLAGIPLHVHAEGLRGTGKTTVMRWARQSLPRITRVAGCAYQCDPDKPRCPQHAGKGVDAYREEIPMPFVEIGHGAKLGTILGSVDLGRLTNPSRPEAALLPGSIPMANRGIIFVDEVNRLAETAPELTDVLLSVMGTKPGLVKIEEVGLPPCEIEVTSSVWAASNPDEDPGPLEDIRRQLADRFDLVVPVQRPSDPSVVERLISGAAGPESGAFAGLPEKASRLKDVRVPPEIVRYMAHLYVHRNVESLRAIEAMELASRLNAALLGKGEVTFEEVLAVIPIVLRHRVEPGTLSEILKDLELRKAAGAQVMPPAPSRDAGRGESGGSGGTASGPNGAGADAPDVAGAGRPVEPWSAAPEPESAPARGPGSPEKGRRTGWFEHLVERYRDAAARARKGRASGRGDPWPGSRPYRLPDPSSLPPASPPDRARRISSIAWEKLVTPPEWKGGAS